MSSYAIFKTNTGKYSITEIRERSRYVLIGEFDLNRFSFTEIMDEVLRMRGVYPPHSAGHSYLIFITNDSSLCEFLNKYAENVNWRYMTTPCSSKRRRQVERKF